MTTSNCKREAGLLGEAGGFLGAFVSVFEGHGFGEEGDGLGDLGVGLGAGLEALDLAELGGEELGLYVGFDPVEVGGDVCVAEVDLIGLEEVLELLEDGVVNGEVAGDGVGCQVVLGEVDEEDVVRLLQQRDLKAVELGQVDLLVWGDATASVDGAAGVGELDFEVGFVGLLGAVADEEVVVGRNAVVVALDEASGGGVVVVCGEGEAGVVGGVEDGLDEALAEGGLADDEGAVVVLQGAGDDLRGGGGVSVDQDDDGVLVGVGFSVGCTVDLVGEGAAALGDDDLALLEELAGDIDGLVEQAAGVAAQVDDEAVQGPAAWKLSRASPTSRPVVSMKLVTWMYPMPGLSRKAISTESRGISSRTRSKESGPLWPSRCMETRTWVPFGPLSMAATAAESRPSADLPSTERMRSPGRIPALNAGVPSNGASTMTCRTPALSARGWMVMPTP